MRSAAFVLAITLVASSARAHVQPSVDVNNRYLKLTPLGDRVRLAYTILFGEIPGARERRRIDADRDGTISEAEAQAFADRLAAEVGGALQLDVDGVAQRVTWAETTMSVGTPQVAAGTFAVDLVAFACLPGGRGRHRIALFDRFRVPDPGEVEVIVEDTPGVTIERAHVGAKDDPNHDFILPAPGAELSEDGLDLAFDAGARAPVTPDATCPAAAAPASSRAWLYAIGAAIVALGGGAAAFVARRRRRSAPR